MKKIIAILLVFIGLSYSGITPNPYRYIPYNDKVQIDNAVEVITTVNKNLSSPEAYHIVQNVYDMSLETEIDFSYIMGIMFTESRFNYKARSYCGAMGLMQIMPNTFESIAKINGLDYKKEDAYDIDKNIRIGVLYLDRLYKKYGHLDYVSAGYNGGPRAANNYKAGKFENIPKQTMNYVTAVRKNKKFFAISVKVDL